MRIVELTCTSCRTVRPFTQPPCVDRHGPECPEWACTDCGAALLIAPPSVPLPRGKGSKRLIAA